MASTSPALPEGLRSQLGAAMDFAASQAERILTVHPNYYPFYTVDGRWDREPERWTHWCEGFFPGILWLLHKHTGETSWREQAERYSRPLEPRRHDRAVHDLGFLFFSTYLRWYRLTGDAALREVLIEAGRTLALRRQKGGYLASFLGPQSLFIDIMMNVGIIFWAANATGDEALREIALRTLPDDGAVPGSARRRHGPRGHLRRRRRADSSAKATQQGCRAGQHVVARPGLGDLRFHGGASASAASRSFSRWPAAAPTATCGRAGRGWCRYWDFDLPAGRAAPLGQLRRRHRGERAVGPGRSGGGGRGAGGATRPRP